MRVNESHFKGVGGLKLFYKIWQPQKKPRGVLVLVHGVGEHINRYGNFVEALVPAGYALAGYDQRGHGQSEGNRGHIRSWADYRGDLDIFLDLVAGLFPAQKVSIYGHSMGSLVVLNYLQHHTRELSSAIISGIATMPADAAPPLQVLMAKALSGLAPKLSINMKLEGAALSRIPEVARAYMEDPLVHWKRSVRWGAEALKTVEQVKSGAGKISLPVMFVHGELDPLCNVEGARLYHDAILSTDKALHIYPDGMHEPHNDLDHQQVAADIRAWLDKHHG